jgi:hypothetical protein
VLRNEGVEIAQQSRHGDAILPPDTVLWDTAVGVTKSADDVMREAARALGSRGGKVGGKSRWRGVTPEERSRQMKLVRAASLKKPKRPKK